MAAASRGKLIIQSIPSPNDREKVVDFLLSFAKGSAREAVAARLDELPLTLGNSMETDTGNRMLTSLQGLGAQAMFVYDRVDTPVNPVMADDRAEQPQKPLPQKDQNGPAAGKAAPAAPSNPATKVRPDNKDIRSLVILLLLLVAVLCGATAIWLPALKAASDPDLLLNKQLQENARMANKSCPRDINPHLRLDGFVAGNKKMTINYTLININSTDINGNDLRPSVSRDIRQGVCREANSAELLKNGITFVFSVHGKDGGMIFDYQVLHEDCDS